MSTSCFSHFQRSGRNGPNLRRDLKKFVGIKSPKTLNNFGSRCEAGGGGINGPVQRANFEKTRDKVRPIQKLG